MTKKQKIQLIEKSLKLVGGRQADLARELNISRQYVNDMLRGRKMSELWVYRLRDFNQKKAAVAQSDRA